MSKRKLQVFISSTFTDLLEERQAAVSSVLKAGHIPAGMELFTAGDQSQMDIIKRWIDESDVYMLILGGRYGSIEPTSGISYTELEYDYALQQGKPVFSSVIDEDALELRVRSRGTENLEKENPKQLAQFRSKVLSNISSFFSDPKDIRLCVYESLSDFSANRDLKGWVSADEVEEAKALHEEIKRLKEENDNLRHTIERLRGLPTESTVITEEAFSELIETLRRIEIDLPGEIRGESMSPAADVLSLMSAFRDELVSGVSNPSGMSAGNKFLYFNIFPKLQLYDLADNEKVPGEKTRRSFLTRRGREFLLYVDKKKAWPRSLKLRVLSKEEAAARETPKKA